MTIYLFAIRNISIGKIRFLSSEFTVFLYCRYTNQKSLIIIILSINFYVLNNLIFMSFPNDLDENADVLQVHLKLYFTNRREK